MTFAGFKFDWLVLDIALATSLGVVTWYWAPLTYDDLPLNPELRFRETLATDEESKR